MTIDPGLLLIDKEAGGTSHGSVGAVRRRTGVRRIGHTGTLDPFATGLLLLCVGTFTRAAAIFHVLPKTYLATMRLGEETESGDPDGAIVRTDESWRSLRPEDIAEAVARRVGASEQVPPAFSAKQVAGVRAYEAARAGRPLELAPMPIVVHAAAVTDIRGADVDMCVRVSTGTYVRALARDIGRDLGCGAHLGALRRMKIGPFLVEDACTISTLEGDPPRCWQSPVAALDWLPRRVLGDAEAVDIGHGRAIEAGEVEAPRLAGEVEGLELPRIVLVHEGRLAALGEAEDGRIRPRTVFPA